MKKMWFLLLLMITVMLTGCCLKHEWVDATCITPKMCSKCGKEEGSPLGHDWEDATCESPKTCATCGKEKGDALHDSFGNCKGNPAGALFFYYLFICLFICWR